MSAALTDTTLPGATVVLNVSRRSFLRGLGLAVGGLALGLGERSAHAAEKPIEPNALPFDGLRSGAFVHVAVDGMVTLVCHRSEMGQGVRSSLPALIAEELGADMARVRILQGDGDKAYGDQNTDGSSSVRTIFTQLREVGATARTLLVAAAAQRWRVDPSTCEARDHAVHHPKSKRSLDFGALAAAAGKLPVPKKVALRPKLVKVGGDLPLVDGPDIVTGKAQFAADVRVDGMLTAVVVRPPVTGSAVAKYDAARALAIKGVRKIVQLPAPQRPFAFQPLGGLAVVADHTWAAMRGAAALDVTWTESEDAVYDSTTYGAELVRSLESPGTRARNVGDVDAALASAAKRLSAVYEAPHLAHATMEPPCAVARWVGGKCEIWASTQNPQAAQDAVAAATGASASDITVHVTFLGGGFGRKSKADFVVEAALIAKEAGAPVRVQWTREDDLRHDYYHTVSAQRLEAGLDAQGKVVAWHHRVAFPPIPSIFTGTRTTGEGELQQGVLDLALDVPNVRAEHVDATAHTRIGWLRSVANIYHAFAAQSFVDELAAARGTDPRDTLLEILGPGRKVSTAELGIPKLPNYGQPLEEHPVDVARLRHVIDRVSSLSRWDQRKAEGRVLGLAAHRSFLAYVGVAVSLIKDPHSGRIQVDEAWIVGDHGVVVNRERVRAQLEGAVIFGMSLALYGAITMKRGATEQDNFRGYRLVRMAESPRRIHVEIVASDAPPAGVGEPGVPPVAPAIGNALFALTGTRVRALPFVRAVPV